VGNLVRTSMAHGGERPRGLLVAECRDGYGIEHTDEAKANALLFAAAPELLEALLATYEALGISYPLHGCDMDKRGAVLAKARAAIAKATGDAA
jgi:hypothetical protein